MSAPLSPTRFALAFWRRKAVQLATATQGVAAVEFAMVLPVMVLVFLGMTEMTSAVTANRKMTQLSRVVADLTARVATMNSTEMNTVFGAAIAVMTPYKSDQVKMVVSSIVVKDTGKKDADGNPVPEGTVCWSTAKGPGATALAKGTKVPLQEGFNKPNTSYIQADVEVSYNPIFGSAILKSLTGTETLVLEEKTPWAPRHNEVVWSGTNPCLAP
jgi:Flp pilus assembly protein TadG